MKVVILAGGLGTRISEETDLKPKPMIEIGGKPILWHIMKIYSSFGFNDFVICCGYKDISLKNILQITFYTRLILQLTYKIILWKYTSLKLNLGKLLWLIPD